jgi:cold shock CspA family protein
MAGIVRWYNPDKGFGFIAPSAGGKDAFIHATALERAGLPSLQEGVSAHERGARRQRFGSGLNQPGLAPARCAFSSLGIESVDEQL